MQEKKIRPKEELFKISTDGVDVKEIMKKIRDNIAKKKLDLLSEDELDEFTEFNFVFQPQPGEIGDELVDNFESIERSWNLSNEKILREFISEKSDWNLDPKYKPSTHRKMSGYFILAFKKIIHPFVRLYTDYIVQRQARINHDFFNSFENMIREQGKINQYLGFINHNLVKELTKNKLMCDTLEYNIKQLKSEIDFLEKREKALEKLITPKS
jgi:hypothetical protein